MEESIARAREIIAAASHVVAFTGAGISAESGIPTYRGAGGMWTKYDPAKFASIDFFMRDPSYYWSFFKEERYPIFKRAEPNAGHRALARLEERGRLACVITQNIDGLHQLAGSRHVVELHGNGRTIVCLKCGRRYSLDEVFEQLQERPVPECEECDGMLKTNVVMFGESLPQEALNEAFAQASQADVLLCIGSSLVVVPAATIPQVAVGSGARLIIVNRDPTPQDHSAAVVLAGPSGEILPRILE